MDKTILIFGASSTYGAGDPQGGWVTRIRQELDAKVSENEVSHTLVYNLGISGGTSEDLRQRFIPETTVRLRKDTLPIFFFAGGGNDAAFVPSLQTFRVVPERFVENIGAMAEEARKINGLVIIQSLTPVNDAVTITQPGKDRSKSNEQVAVFNEHLRVFCNTKEIPFIDAYATFMTEGHLELLCNDGVHPNSRGHQLLSQLILSELEKLG